MSYRTPEDSNILVVDDDPTVIAMLGTVLQEFGKVRFATSGADALRLARQSLPDLVLLDIELPGMSGFDVCKTMKETSFLADIPIIFITSDPNYEVQGLALGAADFIAKPPRPAHVVARVHVHLSLQHLKGVLKRAATTDVLTGLTNRAQFNESLRQQWKHAHSCAAPLGLLAIDIDCFKAFNVKYGYAAGDRCLQEVAQALGRVRHRPTDVIARVGGNEFVILLPGLTGSETAEIARYALRAVSDLRMPHNASTVGDHLTISIGATVYDEQSASWVSTQRDSSADAVDPIGPGETLVWVAEQALSAAKHGGRNHARFLRLDDENKDARALDLRSQDVSPVRSRRHA